MNYPAKHRKVHTQDSFNLPLESGLLSQELTLLLCVKYGIIYNGFVSSLTYVG